jgi:hypothetical protein
MVISPRQSRTARFHGIGSVCLCRRPQIAVIGTGGAGSEGKESEENKRGFHERDGSKFVPSCQRTEHKGPPKCAPDHAIKGLLTFTPSLS